MTKKIKKTNSSVLPYMKLWPEYQGEDSEIREATEYVRSCIAFALQDKQRPRYHFVPVAKEMIDVWGGMQFRGTYRLFYDLNTTAEIKMGGAFMQLMSDDLLHWQQLPIALLSSAKRKELRLNDGCVIIRRDGTPLMYYTSVFLDPQQPREHIPVIGSQDMLTWKRLPGQGAITLENHGGHRYHGNWSDVFFFHHSGRTFMLISKCVTVEGKNEMPIYEATDDSLLNWKYCGVFFDDNGEVVNFVEVNGKWVLIYCPYEKPVWHLGEFDPATCRFIAEKNGVLSYGYRRQGDEHTPMARGFYATSAFETKDGSTCILGWMSGFEQPQGWDGCISLPRILSINANGELCMNPALVVNTLRRLPAKHLFAGNCQLTVGQVFDLTCRFDGTVTISGGAALQLQISPNAAECNGIIMPLKKPLSSFRLLADVSVVEIFFDDGNLCFAEALPMLPENLELVISGSMVSGELFELTLLNHIPNQP